MTFRLTLCLLLASTVPAVAAFEERVDVRRVHLPVYLVSKEPGGCAGVSASDVKLTEDGAELPVLHLDPGRMPAEHVVLLDSSGSVASRLQNVKAAARAYALSLPRTEPAMLASADDDLLLHSPMTTDRERFVQAVDELSIGFQSHLWDGLQQMIRYLAPRGRRSVIVLLSDGCDTDPLGAAELRDVIESAARVPTLTVHAIGLDLPRRCEGTAMDPREALGELARGTGGRFFDLRSPSEVPGVFRRIRARLDEERFVSYAPPRFGEGPKDRAAEHRQRWRRVALSLRSRPQCRIRSASGPWRLESAAPSRTPRETAGPFIYDADTGLLQGTLTDVVRDSGTLARRGLLASPSLEISPGRQLRERYVATAVPPLRRVVWPGAQPAYALFYALMQLTPEAAELGLPSIEPGLTDWTAAPFLVNGRTLLGQRLALGVALAGHPEYRSWAVERLRERRLADLDALVPELKNEADVAAFHAVRDFIAGDEWEPSRQELAPLLSEWLGDVPALELHRAAEAWLIERLLIGARRPGAAAAPADWIALSEQLWQDLDLLFGEHRAVRTFGLLVPGYDPGTERLGFYRIVLPRPATLVNAWHNSPDAPRGVYLLNWALAQPAFRDVFGEAPLGVGSVVYRPLYAKADEILELADAAVPIEGEPVSVVRVEVELVSRGPARERSVLRGVFAFRQVAGVPPDEPLCIETARDAAEGLRSKRLIDSLVGARRASATPCVVESEVLDGWGSHDWTSAVSRK
jgi:hypothetical protein